MILKTPHGPIFYVYGLTQSMLEVIKSQRIPLHQVGKIASYHDDLSYGEVAGILKFQHVIAKKLQVIPADVTPLFGEGYDGKMVEGAFNGLDSDAIVSSVYDKTDTFSMLNAGANVLVVLFHTESQDTPAGWSPVDAKTFSGALLETLYANVGYLESHQGQPVFPKAGELSYAEVFRLLEVENPL